MPRVRANRQRLGTNTRLSGGEDSPLVIIRNSVGEGQPCRLQLVALSLLQELLQHHVAILLQL